jgi:pyridinium-3,5-bisthiocarboxylic acid mononucleotide nickel chelatase
MRIAYFDTYSGICGDMILGAFINAGIPLDRLREELGGFRSTGYAITARSITRDSIAATRVEITLEQSELAEPGRSYLAVVRLIDESRLSDGVKGYAKLIYRTLAEAEAKIHGTALEDVHFHELGRLDSILDVVGIAICMELYCIEKVFSSCVPTGSGGLIETQHGTLPIPAPATLEILKYYPMQLTDIPYELTTPTGAAVLVSLSEGLLCGNENLQVECIGYGAGGRDIPGVPGLLRLIIGSISDTRLEQPRTTLSPLHEYIP